MGSAHGHICTRVALQSDFSHFFNCACMSFISPTFWDNQIMLISSKRSRTAKNKCDNAHAAFRKCATSAPSLGNSDYCVSDSNSDTSIISVWSSEDEHEGSDIELSVKVLQCFYLIFLPPLLHMEGKIRGKHRKVMNKRPVYIGDSRMTRWWKKSALSLAAEECTMLDRFIVRKVCT